MQSIFEIDFGERAAEQMGGSKTPRPEDRAEDGPQTYLVRRTFGRRPADKASDKSRLTDLGLEASRAGLKLSVRNGGGYSDRTISGYDLTDVSKLSPSDVARLRRDLASGLSALGTRAEDIRLAAVSCPAEANYRQILDFQEFLYSLGISHIRSLSPDAAKGLYVCYSAEVRDELAVFVKEEGGRLELCASLLDGTLAEGCHKSVLPADEAARDPEALQRGMTELLSKARSAADEIKSVAIYIPDISAGLYGVISQLFKFADRIEKADEYTGSRGALIEAEILSGEVEGFLALQEFPDELRYSVNGGDLTPFRNSNYMVPARLKSKISTSRSARTELEFFLVNNCTRAKERLCRAVISGAQAEAEVTADIEADLEMNMDIETEGLVLWD